VWTTAYIVRNHGCLVYDTLFGTDEHLRVKPQMVDRVTVSADGMEYTFTLRDNLRWHDGRPVQAEDCVESLRRWGRKDRFGGLLMALLTTGRGFARWWVISRSPQRGVGSSEGQSVRQMCSPRYRSPGWQFSP
jgi:ABC-type transport system substrate-binding protein